jgi:hypothetical protein
MQIALQTPDFLSRMLARAVRPQVTKWYAAHVREGATREIPVLPGRMTVHCRDGEAWITHDGDPKDIFIQAKQSYLVQRGERMTLHAMRGDCVLEIEVDE